MSNSMDLVLAQMAELTNAVKEAKQPKQELQWEDIEQKFSDQIEALVTAQVAEKVKAQRVPGTGVGVGEQLKDNRYAPWAKSFERDGVHKEAGIVYKPIDLVLARIMMEGQRKHWSAQISVNRPEEPSSDLQSVIKAMTSTGAGTGDELVPLNLRAQLWEDFFLASRVASTITRVDQPTDPFDIPLGLGAVTWRKGTQNVATTASDPATAKVTLTTTELVTEQNWSYTLNEDAIIAMAPAIRARLAQSGAEVMDAFALNADATNAANGNINLDDADPADDSYYLSEGQDGIRHQWLVDNTAMTHNAGGDALIDSDIVTAFTLMGKYAVNPMDLVIVCDVKTYLYGFLSTGTGKPGEYVITIDKFGPQATVLTGQLAAYRGVPIIVSASHPQAEADGKVSTTANNNTLGSASIYNRNMWYLGLRRDLMIETDRDIQKRQYIMVTSFRQSVGAHGTRSTNTHTSGIRNIALSG